jgi:hypothetical protein
MKKLILLIAVLLPGVVLAQNMAQIKVGEKIERSAEGWVFVKDGNGRILRTFFSPTPEIALGAIQREGSSTDYARKILRQTVEMRSALELDAFADELARLVLESSSRRVASAALSELEIATWTDIDQGIPYERGLELLIDIYEAMDGTETVSTYRMWIAIFFAGGEEYLKNLFASLEPPAKPCWLRPSRKPRNAPPEPPQEEWCPYRGVPWCQLGMFLSLEKVENVDPSYVFSTCNKYFREFDNGNWAPVYF